MRPLSSAGRRRLGLGPLGLLGPQNLLVVVAVDVLGAELATEHGDIGRDFLGSPAQHASEVEHGAFGVLLDGQLLEDADFLQLGVLGPLANGCLIIIARTLLILNQQADIRQS